MSGRDLASQIRIASPCDVDWDSMFGNDRVRFCEHCQRTVHNVDLLTKKQLRRLIARSGDRLCVNYQQPLPQISSTPVLYKIGRRTSVLVASAFSATLSISSAVAAAATPKSTEVPTQRNVAARVANAFVASANAKLYGFVFSPNGDPINGATVTLSSTENGESHITHTSRNGQFRIDDIVPGTYKLTIVATGFDTTDVPNVVVRAGDNNRIDQTLSMASSGEEESNVVTTRLSGGMVLAVATNPLVAAVRDDDMDAVKTLLLSKPDVNARDPATRYTALERAVMNGNREIIQVLLWNKADVSLRDEQGETILMVISEDTTSEVVWDLINAGAKVNLRDNDGDTALITIAQENNVEALQALLDAGAKVNAANNEGKTALMVAADNGLVHNVRALILAGANVNARDKEGKTALMYAFGENSQPVIRLLKAHGAIEFEAPEKQ
ncbi:MAG TPA: ankyrin repeat domain-containing protein [Pyrinomonadaceae bacterium]|nr:ankyrin repeat domain-containing protein [Pyrinomonadaceae bacterium]